MTVSVVNDLAGEQTRLLAVLYCDVNPGEDGGSAGLEIALWRQNHFRAARELVVEYGGAGGDDRSRRVGGHVPVHGGGAAVRPGPLVVGRVADRRRPSLLGADFLRAR